MLNLKNPFKSDRGMVVPAVLFTTLIAGALASTAVGSAIVAMNQSTRDREVKRAMQAADAGLQAALYRLNMLEPAKGECIKAAANGDLSKAPAPPAAGNAIVSIGGVDWCKSETFGNSGTPMSDGTPAEQTTDGMSFNYRVSDLDTVRDTRTIVSTGYAADGKIQRRVAATAKRQVDVPLFEHAVVAFEPSTETKITGDSNLYEDCYFNDPTKDVCGASVATMSPALRIDGSGTNVCGQVYDGDGMIEVKGGSNLNPPNVGGTPYNPEIGCPQNSMKVYTGTPKPWPGPEPTSTATELCQAGSGPVPGCGDAARYKWTHAAEGLPPDKPVKDAEIPNPNDQTLADNCRLRPLNALQAACTSPSPATPPADTWSGNLSDFTYNPATRSLQMKGNATLYLYGRKAYVFCYIGLSTNARLHFMNGTKVYMMSREWCAANSGQPNPPVTGAVNQWETWGSVVVSGTNAAIYNNSQGSAPYRTDPDGSKHSKPDLTSLQFYLAGSNAPLSPGFTNTSPQFTNFYSTSGANNEDEFSAVIWAPRSQVNLHYAGEMTGAVVSRTAIIDTHMRLKYNDTAKQLVDPGAFHRMQNWSECTTATPGTGTSPTTGCDS